MWEEVYYKTLVNPVLKRWCTYPKACAMSCKNHRNYTVGEFYAMNKSI